MAFLLTSDGVRLHHVDEGSGPAVLLVGGHTSRLSSWHFQREALLAAGHRVVRLDRRHTGDSDFPAHGQRLARQGADLLEVVRELRLEGCVAVGSSMGASALLAAVDLHGRSPFAALVLVDQTPRMVNEDEWALGFHGLTWDGVERFVREFPAGVTAFHVPPPAEVLAVLSADPAPPYPFAATRALLRDHTVQDWRDVVARLDVPVLAVGGRHSPVWPVASQEWIAAHAPQGELVVLEDSGHAPHVSEPQAFNAALLDFLGRHGRPPHGRASTVATDAPSAEAGRP